MKLLRIAGENLTSLAEPFVLDFESGPLQAANVFAIVGATGAGKTTLLDTLCLALYGTAPRLATGRTVRVGEEALTTSDPRSLVRRGAASAFAEVWFEDARGERWKSRWSVQRGGRSARTLRDAEMILVSLDDGRRVGGHKTETQAEICQKVGLDFDQFARTVVLAQGDFARLLHAPGKERAAILEWLTDSAVYTRLSQLAYARATAREAELSAIEQELQALGTVSPEALAQLREALAVAEAGAAAARAARATADLSFASLREELKLREQANNAEANRVARAEELGALGPLVAEIARVSAVVPVAPHLVECALVRQAEAATTIRSREASAALAVAEPSLTSAGLAHTAAAAESLSARANEEAAAPNLARARALDQELNVTRVRGTEARAQHRDTTVALGEEQRLEAEIERKLAAAAESALLAEKTLSSQACDTSWIDRWSSIAATLGRLQVLEEEARREDTKLAVLREAAVVSEVALTNERLNLGTAEGNRHEAEKRAAEARAALVSLDRARHAATLRSLAAREGGAHQATSAHQAARAAIAALAEAQGAEARHAAAAVAARADAARLWAGVQLAHGAMEEAEQAARRIQDQLKFSEHRDRLRPGDPCPLCGAREHPLGGLSLLGRVLEDAHENAAAKQGAWNQLHGEHARAEARADTESAQMEAARRRAEEATSRLGDAQDRGRGAALADAGTDRAEEALATTWAALGRERAAAAARESALAEADRGVSTADLAVQITAAAESETRSRIERLSTDKARNDVALAQAAAAATGRAEERASRLGELASGCLPPWACDLVATDAAAALDRLGPLAEELLRARAFKDEAASAIAELQPRSEAQKLRVEAALRHESELRKAVAAAEALWLTLQKQRKELWEGRPVEAVVSEFRAAVDLAERKLQATAAALVEAKEAVAAAGARRLAAAEQEQSAAEARQRSEGLLAVALAAVAMTEAEARQAEDQRHGWLPGAESRLGMAQRALAAAEVRRADAAAALQRHVDSRSSAPIPLEEARAELEQAAEAESAAAERVGNLKLQLEQAADRELARRDGVARLAGARQAAEVWFTLRELIGQKDGAKFRNFAQSLTLDLLLAEANEHLAELAPRYQIERIPSENLELQVVDQDRGGEARGVPTLSGGETFLVSLALALGLSALAAHRHSVDCLFIDEGFGTLDPQSLDLALSVLDALQGEGRRVGIISHVSGLPERVSAQVRVTEVSKGRSRVSVVHSHTD